MEQHNNPSPGQQPAQRTNPALLVGGAAALIAAGALATVVVMKQPDETQATPVAQATTEPARSADPTPAPLPVTPPAVAPAPKPAAAPTAAPRPAARPAPQRQAAAPVCTDCGVVQAVTAVRHNGEGTGLGAVAGGVVGGVIGNQMGGGRGKDAMTVLGAVGGGVAGHKIEQRQRATTEYRIEVRMQDGSVRTLTQAQPLTVGQNVRVVGEQAVVAGDTAAPAPRG